MKRPMLAIALCAAALAAGEQAWAVMPISTPVTTDSAPAGSTTVRPHKNGTDQPRKSDRPDGDGPRSTAHPSNR